MPVEQTAKVKLKFHADTAQARREIDKLDKKQKQAANTAVQSSKAQQAAVKGQIESLGKLAIGIGAAVVAFKQLTESAKAFAKESQLKTAAAGYDIRRIKDAARGLITEYEALSLAAATANTDFKLSQKEMEEVAKFMVVLRNQGNDLKTVYDGVTKALVEGNVRGLRQFGIILHASSGKAEAHAKIMERIRAENKKAGDNIELVGDKALQAANKMSDAGHQMSMTLGRIANHLVPVVELVERIVSGWAAIISLGKSVDIGGGTAQQNIERLSKRRSELRNKITRLNEKGAAPYITAPLGVQLAEVQAELDELRGAMAMRQRTLARPSGAGTGFSWDEIYGYGARIKAAAFAKPPKRPRGAGRGYTTSLRGGRVEPLAAGQLPTVIPGLEEYAAPDLPGGVGMEQQGFFAELEGRNVAMQARADAIKEALESIITPAQILENVGSQALQSFAGAAGEAFGAIIDGSKGAGEAFKEFMGQALFGMSKKLAGDAVYEGVQALIALARSYWDPKALAEAKAHTVAAGTAAAGAATLGALAKLLGVGGSTTPPPTTPPGAEGAIGGASADGARSVAVFVGSDFEDNARSNASRLSRAFARARQTEGDDSVVVFN